MTGPKNPQATDAEHIQDNARFRIRTNRKFIKITAGFIFVAIYLYSQHQVFKDVHQIMAKRITETRTPKEEDMTTLSNIVHGNSSLLPMQGMKKILHLSEIIHSKNNEKGNYVNQQKQLRYMRDYAKVHSLASNYSVDILIVGSKNQTELPETQFRTWASHMSARYFVVATELDSFEPDCQKTMTTKMLEDEITYCKTRKTNNELTLTLKRQHGRIEWLRKKKSPVGWLCAQKRFGYTLGKMLEVYDGRNENGIDFPDYLVLADDDTYLDMEVFTKEFLTIPIQQRTETPEEMLTPPPDVPIVYAGCRVRHPVNQFKHTHAYGGFGMYFSRAAIQRMTVPLHCGNEEKGGNNGSFQESIFKEEACRRMQPGQDTIGELRYYKPGMTIGELMLAYTKQEPHFCHHSDFFVSYFVQYYNVSRHTITRPQFKDIWRWDDKMAAVPYDRLHVMDDAKGVPSEIYRINAGNCYREGAQCNVKANVCHRVDIAIMEKVFAAKQEQAARLSLRLPTNTSTP